MVIGKKLADKIIVEKIKEIKMTRKLIIICDFCKTDISLYDIHKIEGVRLDSDHDHDYFKYDACWVCKRQIKKLLEKCKEEQKIIGV